MTIAVRADGHKRIGMGHLHRMLTLARHLRETRKAEIVFITRNNRSALDLIDARGFRTWPLPYSISRRLEIDHLVRLIDRHRPDLLLVDLLQRCHDSGYMRSLAGAGPGRLAAFTDTHAPAAVEADVVFNASIFQKAADYPAAQQGRYRLGLAYVILPQGYAAAAETYQLKAVPEKVVVCMGGADHHDLTCPVVAAIDESRSRFSIDIVVSRAFFDPDAMARFAAALKHETRLIYDADGLLEHLWAADMAVTAGGTVMVERMCLGVPGMAVSQLRHQDRFVKEIARQGAVVDLGPHPDLDRSSILGAFDALFCDPDRRRQISDRGKSLVDGRGLQRIAAILDGREDAGPAAARRRHPAEAARKL